MLVSYDRKLALWEAIKIQTYYEISSYIYFCSSAGLQIINVPLHVLLVFIAPCLAINFVILPVSLLTTLISVAHLVAMSQSKGCRERMNRTHMNMRGKESIETHQAPHLLSAFSSFNSPHSSHVRSIPGMCRNSRADSLFNVLRSLLSPSGFFTIVLKVC